MQAQVLNPPSGCSTNAVVTVSDGTTSVPLTISGAANDSGPLSVHFLPGAQLKLSVSTAASCGAAVNYPSVANVSVQYKSD